MAPAAAKAPRAMKNPNTILKELTLTRYQSTGRKTSPPKTQAKRPKMGPPRIWAKEPVRRKKERFAYLWGVLARVGGGPFSLGGGAGSAPAFA